MKEKEKDYKKNNPLKKLELETIVNDDISIKDILNIYEELIKSKKLKEKVAKSLKKENISKYII